MIREFEILLAITSIASASVIVNVFDEIKAEPSIRENCNYQACDQLCRRLGFPGGACVGDKCECDNFKPMTITRKALNHLLRSTRGIKGTHFLGACNFQACEQLCRNLGFPGGACVGNRCDCDNFAEEKDVTPKAVGQLKDCVITTCDDMCHRLHYADGMCIDGDCMCF